MDFFGDLDKNGKGKVASEYPAWYYDVHLDNLREDVSSAKRALAAGRVSAETVQVVKAEIEQGSSKIEQIEKTRPKLSDKERDGLWKLYKEELCPLISANLFSRSSMQKGLASGHEEAKRMVECRIPVKSELLATMLTCANGKVVSGKTNRNSLAKVFKMVGKLLGEATNIEVLRAD
jgi:hypothetical protein